MLLNTSQFFFFARYRLAISSLADRLALAQLSNVLTFKNVAKFS